MVDLQLNLNPKEYFHQQILEAATKQQVCVDEQVSFYLVNLLVNFIDPKNLTVNINEHEDIDALETPLALMLSRLPEVSEQEQIRILKLIGDTSLYFTGYFQDFFNRKIFNIDYYVAMGRHAYGSLANKTKKPRVFKELNDRFVTCVDIMSEVSSNAPIKQNQDLLNVYDRWTRSHSTRLLKILQEFGINPIPTKQNKAS